MTKLNIFLIAVALFLAAIAGFQNWGHKINAVRLEPGVLSLEISSSYEPSGLKFYAEQECKVEHVVSALTIQNDKIRGRLFSAGIIDVYFKYFGPDSDNKCTFVGTFKLSDSKPYLGLNYEQRNLNGVWFAEGWTNNRISNRQILKRDFGILRGLGINSLQVNFQPEQTGFKILRASQCKNAEKGCDAGLLESKKMDEIVDNLTAQDGILKTFEDFNMQISPTFDKTTYFGNQTSSNWSVYYGDSKEGWMKFTRDAVKWVTYISNSIEMTGVGQHTALYYDLWKNFSYVGRSTEDNSYFIRNLFRGANGIAAARKAISLSSLCELVKLKGDLESVGAGINFIVVKKPAESADCQNLKVTGDTNRVQFVRQFYPPIFGVFSEMAISRENSENSLNEEINEFQNEMRSGAYGGMRQGLWDEVTSENKTGLGKDPDHLYEIFGKYTDQFPYVNSIPNGGDFENTDSEKGWSTSSGTIERKDSSFGVPATGKYFLRYTGNSKICSPPIFLVNRVQLAVTANVRSSSGNDIFISLEANRGSQKIKLGRFNGPTMKNIHNSESPGFMFKVADGTRFGRVCLESQSKFETDTIDLDAVSISSI